MTVLSDFIDQVRTWLVHPEYSDLLVDSFIRTAESNLSRSLRVKEMVELTQITNQAGGQSALPADWAEIEFINYPGHDDLEYISRPDFFGKKQPLGDKYTIVGNNLRLGNETLGTIAIPLELAYYKNVPHITVEGSWLHTSYYDLFLQACLVPGLMYGLEQDRATAVMGYVATLVSEANDQHMISKISGSQLKMPRAKMRLG